jgi:acetyl-CoA decarbonylase/synthase complex subunit delta
MAFQIPKINYTGKIREVTVGSGPSAITVGGESCYPFYRFEGDMPHPPKIAFEVWDYAPDDWQEWAVEPYKDVMQDPAAWAKKCVDVYGAELIALLLKSADPNGLNRDVEACVETVKKVADAIASRVGLRQRREGRIAAPARGRGL